MGLRQIIKNAKDGLKNMGENRNRKKNRYNMKGKASRANQDLIMQIYNDLQKISENNRLLPPFLIRMDKSQGGLNDDYYVWDTIWGNNGINVFYSTSYSKNENQKTASSKNKNDFYGNITKTQIAK